MRLTPILIVLLFLGAALPSTGCYRARPPAVAGPNSTELGASVAEAKTADGATSTTDVGRRPADDGALGEDNRTGELTWDELWPRLRAQLRQDQLDDARQTLADLKRAKIDLTADQSAELNVVEAELHARRLASDERSEVSCSTKPWR